MGAGMFDEFDREVFASGEHVFRYGDQGDCAYLVEEGVVEVFVEEQGRERRIKLIGKGELFGEVTLIDRLLENSLDEWRLGHSSLTFDSCELPSPLSHWLRVCVFLVTLGPLSTPIETGNDSKRVRAGQTTTRPECSFSSSCRTQFKGKTAVS